MITADFVVPFAVAQRDRSDVAPPGVRAGREFAIVPVRLIAFDVDTTVLLFRRSKVRSRSFGPAPRYVRDDLSGHASFPPHPAQGSRRGPPT